jgi:hypothetical protein
MGVVVQRMRPDFSPECGGGCGEAADAAEWRYGFNPHKTGRKYGLQSVSETKQNYKPAGII